MSEPDAATHTDANDETAVRTDAAAGAEAPAEAGPEAGPDPERNRPAGLGGFAVTPSPAPRLA